MLKLVVGFILCIVITPNIAFAEQILTTLRSDANNTIFDGKWTFLQEWKSTSEDIVEYDDGTKFVIKTGHDYENLYVLIDFITGTSFNKSADRGIVCFDTKMNRSTIPDKDDYCFSVVLGSQRVFTLQGGNFLAQKGYWIRTENHPNLVAAGNISDKNDRYTGTPHSTYEFKIPIEAIGRSDMYGFYVGVYDAKSHKEYSWPKYIANERYPYVSAPDKWGELVSPDKSIPELKWPTIVLLSAIFFVVFISRFKNKQL